MQTELTSRYPEAARLRLPKGMSAALATAAQRRHQSISDWTRQALLRCLEVEGIIVDSADEAEVAR
jgi:predicted HicB family RNase H-like nuclease